MSNPILNIYNQNGILAKYLNYEGLTIHDIDLSKLSDIDLKTFKSFKSEKRQLEFYHLRVLWQSFNIPQPILYKSSGKPFLKQGYLSMTHSHQRVIIAYSNQKELGVDIEMISDKLNVVKPKFLHPKDHYESLEDLTKLWTIKEAVYKLFDGDDLFFMDDIRVENDSAFINHNHYNLQATTQTFKLDGKFMVTIAVKKP